MKRVFINALCAGNRSGTGRYATELTRALAELDLDLQLDVAVEKDGALARSLPERPNLKLHPQPHRPPWGRALWETFALPRLVRKNRIDLFHGPAFINPPMLSCPSLVTIHDCVFARFPRTIPRARRLYYAGSIRRSANAARMIPVDSESTGRDVVEQLEAPPRKIRVIPLGVEPRFFAASPNTETQKRLRERIDLPGDFFLTLGTIEPRKNLDRLIRAYAEIHGRHGGQTPPLVVAGRMGWMSERLESLTHELGVSEKVRFPGFVADEDLPALLAMTTIFVCVSLYEGFGLPALEALAAGAPSVVSDNSSLPEVVGSAAVLTTPHDPSAIAGAIEGLWQDPALREDLAFRGPQRAGKFTWEKTAQETIRLYREILTGH